MYECVPPPELHECLQYKVKEAKADIRRLKEEITALRQEVIDLRDNLHHEICAHKMSKRKLDDTVRRCEVEKSSILSKQDELLSKVHGLEETVECLNQRVQEVVAEKAYWQTQSANLKSLNEQLEMSIKDHESSLNDIERDFASKRNKIKLLEAEKKTFIESLNETKNEVQHLKDKLNYAKKENKSLKDRFEYKVKGIGNLERENSKKYLLINQLEEKVSRLSYESLRTKNEEERLQKEVATLKKELQSIMDSNSKLNIENRKLSASLESTSKILELKECDFQKVTSDYCKLKEKMLCYAEKYERLKESKDKDKEELSYYMKSLETKNESLETRNSILENESTWANNNLHIAKEKLDDLQITLSKKDTLICDLECQINALSNEISSLRNDLSKQEQLNMKLKSELSTCKEMISNIEYENDAYEADAQAMEKKIEEITGEIAESQIIIDELTSQLESQKRTIICLEDAITASRREAREESLQTLTVHNKLQELQASVSKLQDKLCNVSSGLSSCQTNCKDYKSQKSSLKFQIGNERSIRGSDAAKLNGVFLPMNGEPKDICSYDCSCDNKGKVYFKNKEIPNSRIQEQHKSEAIGSGHFTITVNSDHKSLIKKSPCSDGLDHSRASSSHFNDVKCSSDFLLPGESHLKNKSNVKNEFISNSDVTLQDAITIHKSHKITLLREEPHKGILKGNHKLFDSNPLGITPETSFCNIKYPRQHSKVIDQSFDMSDSNHFRDVKNEFSSDNAGFLSIGPTYKVMKKSYKKVYFSGSEEELSDRNERHKK